MRTVGPLLALASAWLAASPAVAAVRCGAAGVGHGGVHRLEDCGPVDVRGGAEPAARAAVDRVAGALRVAPADLRTVSVRQGAAGTTVRFVQTAGGVPVRDAQVVVALDGAAVRWIASSAQGGPVPSDLTPSVARARAERLARARAPEGELLRSRARLVIARGTLGWDVRLTTVAPAHAWRVLVDARRGHVLEVVDELRSAEAANLAYDPNPVQTTGDTSLTDGGDATTAALNAARRPVTLTDLTDAGSLVVGAFANPTVDLQSCGGPDADALRAVTYTRTQEEFEQVSAYHAVTSTHALLARLGFGHVLDFPVEIAVHCGNQDRSFYDDGALHLGDGGVDDAEDADVTVHEYGHAVQDDQVPGFGPGEDTEQRAIGEGFGDLLAVLRYMDSGDPGYIAQRRFCVAEWDATSYNPVDATAGSGCLRWTDGRDEGSSADIGTYAGTPSDEHDDGRYWAAAMTCVLVGREAAGVVTAQARDDLLRLVLAHHELLVPTRAATAFEDSVAALINLDRTLFARAHQRLIADCARQRLGIHTELDATPPAVTPVAAGPAGSHGWYRGDVRVEFAVDEPDSPFETDGCDPRTITADTAGTEITCTVTSDGGLTAETVTVRRDATPPTIAPRVQPALLGVGTQAAASPNAADALSGLAMASCGSVDTRRAGAFTVTCRAADMAGNATAATIPYTVMAPPLALRIGEARITRATVRIPVTLSRAALVRGHARARRVGRLRSRPVAVRPGVPRAVVLRTRRPRRLLRRARRGRLRLRVAFRITEPASRPVTLRRTVRVPRLRQRPMRRRPRTASPASAIPMPSSATMPGHVLARLGSMPATVAWRASSSTCVTGFRCATSASQPRSSTSGV